MAAAEPEPEPDVWDVFGDDSASDPEDVRTHAQHTQPALMEDDLFGSNSSDEDTPGCSNSAVDPALLSQLLRMCPRRVVHQTDSEQEVEGKSQGRQWLPALVLLAGGADSRLERQELRRRLRTAGAEVEIQEEVAAEQASFDCVCAFLPPAGEPLLALRSVSELGRQLLPAGLLLIYGGTSSAIAGAGGQSRSQLPDPQNAIWRQSFSPDEWKVEPLAPPGGAAASTTFSAPVPCICLRRVSLPINYHQRGEAIHHIELEADRGRAERARIEEVTLARSAAERQAGVISEHNFQKAKTAMQEHGMCIIRALFPPEAVLERGALACAQAARALAQQRGVISGSSGSTQSVEKTDKETALPFNVNADKFTVLCPELGRPREGLSLIHPVLVSILEAVALEPPSSTSSTAGATKDGSSNGRLLRSALRRSDALLQVQPMGAVVALPSASRQAIHPDAEHLYEHTHLPPHYAVLFLPAVAAAGAGSFTVSAGTTDDPNDPRDPNDPATMATDHSTSTIGDEGHSKEQVWSLGQTAFLLGSPRLSRGEALLHGAVSDSDGEELDGSGSMNMTSDDDKILDADERLGRARGRVLLRPHCEAGDALLFDARLLHWGLPNTTDEDKRSNVVDDDDDGGGGDDDDGTQGQVPRSEGVVGMPRPLLYVNYHRPWFADYQPGGQIIVRHKNTEWG